VQPIVLGSDTQKGTTASTKKLSKAKKRETQKQTNNTPEVSTSVVTSPNLETTVATTNTNTPDAVEKAPPLNLESKVTEKFDIFDNVQFEELDPEEQAKLDKEVEEFRQRLELCSPKYSSKVANKPIAFTPHGEIKQI